MMLKKDSSIVALDTHLKGPSIQKHGLELTNKRNSLKHKSKSKCRNLNEIDNSNEKGSRTAIDTSNKRLRRFQIYNSSASNHNPAQIPEVNCYSTTEGDNIPSININSIIKKSSKKKKSTNRFGHNGVKFEDSNDISPAPDVKSLYSQSNSAMLGLNFKGANFQKIDI